MVPQSSSCKRHERAKEREKRGFLKRLRNRQERHRAKHDPECLPHYNKYAKTWAYWYW